MLTLKSDKCMVVAVARATHPPDGLHPNQALVLSVLAASDIVLTFW